MEMFFKSQKALNIIDKIRNFLFSNWWFAFLFVLAGIFTTLGAFYPAKNIEVIGTLTFAIIISICFILSDDIMAIIAPAMLGILVAIKCYDSYGVFSKHWWISIPFVLGAIFHFVTNRHRAKWDGYLLKPMLFVSVAIMLGGIGFITYKEYFAPTSIYHMFFLGFGMVYFYGMLRARVEVSKRYDAVELITRIMVLSGMFASFMVLSFYAVNYREFLSTKAPLFMQWRNNCSTILILSMPFAFYMAHKKPYMAIMGFVFYIAMLLTDSRGGMIFGMIELLLCIIAYIIMDKKRRKLYIVLCSVGVVAALILLKGIMPFVSHTLNRFLSGVLGFFAGDPNEVRTVHFARGINDFLNNPIFGTGIGYMGNRDVFESKAFALCWYHCEPIQIAASFGVAGIIAYIYQFIKRNLLIFRKTNLFNVTVFLSYISLEMMSLVNPGVFCPLPYVFLITLFFVIVEKKNEEIDKTI